MKIETKKSVLYKTSNLLLSILKVFNINDNFCIEKRVQDDVSSGIIFEYYKFNIDMYISTLSNGADREYIEHKFQDLILLSNFNELLVENETWIEKSDFIVMDKIYKKYKNLGIGI